MNDIQILIDRQIGFCNRINYDNILKRLVVNSGESFNSVQEGDPPIFACRFAETAGYEHILALANEDGIVGLQNTTKYGVAKPVDVFQCHNNAVFDLAWMPRSMKFVTVSGDHTAQLWEVEEGTPQKVQVFSAHTRSVKTVAFRPTNSSSFATGGRDGHILLWDERDTPRPALHLTPEDVLVRCHSRTPHVPRASPAPKRPRPEDHRATSITGLVFQDDNTLISCGECDGNIKVWDLRKNYGAHRREPLPKHSIPYCGSSAKNGFTNLAIDRPGMRLYASCMDSVIYCYNVSTYSPLPERRYVGHENNTFYVKACLSPDGHYLVSGSSDRHAYVWNVHAATPLVRLVGHWAEVTCPAWCHAHGTRLVTCSDDARHNVWKVGREEYDHREEAALCGRAEPLPRSRDPPHWGASGRSPGVALKRRPPPCVTPTSAGNERRSRNEGEKKSKRCLADMLNAVRDDELSADAKRARTDLPPSGLKRPLADDRTPSSPSKRLRVGDKENVAGPSPSRVTSFSSPTENLPDFVSSGEAPHLRLMSPVKKRESRNNWLADLSRKCFTSGVVAHNERPTPPAPTPPRPHRQSNTLLKYFNRDK